MNVKLLQEWRGSGTIGGRVKPFDELVGGVETKKICAKEVFLDETQYFCRLHQAIGVCTASREIGNQTD
jgi:hypothetical protein